MNESILTWSRHKNDSDEPVSREPKETLEEIGRRFLRRYLSKRGE